MRKLSIPLLSLLILLTGCLFPPTPSTPFVREVHVDVLHPAPGRFLMNACLPKDTFAVGEDILLSLQLDTTPEDLREATYHLVLYYYPAGKHLRTQRVRSATLSHLHAGSLQLTLSTAHLSPGNYILDVYFIDRDFPRAQSLPFTLDPVRTD